MLENKIKEKFKEKTGEQIKDLRWVKIEDEDKIVNHSLENEISFQIEAYHDASKKKIHINFIIDDVIVKQWSSDIFTWPINDNEEEKQSASQFCKIKGWLLYYLTGLDEISKEELN